MLLRRLSLVLVRIKFKNSFKSKTTYLDVLSASKSTRRRIHKLTDTKIKEKDFRSLNASPLNSTIRSNNNNINDDLAQFHSRRGKLWQNTYLLIIWNY